MIEVGKTYLTPDGYMYQTLWSTPYNDTRFWTIVGVNGRTGEWPEAHMTDDIEVFDGE